MIAYYNFGATTASTANQGTAGTAADGVLMGGAQIVDIDVSDDGVEWVLQLSNDSTNSGWVNHQYMNITNGDDSWYDNAIPYEMGARTYAAWVRMDTDTIQDWSTFMSKGFETGLAMGCGTPFGNGMDQVVFSYHSCIASWCPLNGTVSAMSDNEWIHVVATIDGEDFKTASLYINGQLQDTRQTWGPLYANDLDLLIGDEPNRTANDFGWNGMIDDVRIYDEHMDAQDVLDLFNSTYSPFRDKQIDIRILPVAVLTDPSTTSEVRTELPDTIHEIPVGTTYYVEIWASDVGGANTGLTSVYVDVSFCGEMSATTLEHGTLFSTFSSGTIQPGGVNEFGGSGLGSGIEPEWVRVGWIEMSADSEVSKCTISLLESSSGVAAQDRGLIPWEDIYLGSIAIYRDCNGNGIPDADDIADGNSVDDNGDGIPDECQLDVRVAAVATLIDPDITSEVRTSLPESAEAVVRGGIYYVEIWASDVGYTNTGLTEVYVDLSFCSQSSATNIEHGTIFTTSPSGTIQSGGVDEFGGTAVPDGGGIDPEWVRVGWIQMSADVEIASCAINLLPSSTGVSTLHGGQLPWAFVDFNSVNLEITPPARSYDLDGDEIIIGPGDWSYFVGSWLKPVPPADEEDDFDCDCFVGVGDLSWLATAWMKSPSDPTILYPPCLNPSCAGASMLVMDNDMFGSGQTTFSTILPDVAFGLVILDAPSVSETTTVLPTSIAGITGGQTYYVEVWVSDVGDIDTGVTSAYVDLSFPNETLSVVSISHGSTFTVLTDGSAGTGVIDDLGGSTLSEAVGVEPEWARVAVVEMYATLTPISATFMLLPSSTGVSSWGRGVIAWSDIFLDSLTDPIADFDFDGDIDIVDFSLFASVWRSSFGNGNWKPIYDIYKPNDYIINYADLSVLAANWLVGVE